MKMPIRIMPCDISTWWNLTYDMLYFAVENRAAIEALTLDRKNDLRQFELEEEWDVAEELMDTLEVHDAIVTTLSDKSYLLYCHPWLAFGRFSKMQHYFSLPTLQQFFRPWTTLIQPSWTTPCQPARSTLLLELPLVLPRKHWTNITPLQTTLNYITSQWVWYFYTFFNCNGILILYVSLVFHSHHKLAYFKSAGWDQSWIDTAKGIVHEQFESRYASHGTTVAVVNEKSPKDDLNALKEKSKVHTILFFPYVWFLTHVPG